MSRKATIVLIILVTTVIVVGTTIVSLVILAGGFTSSSRNKVGLIRIEGVITSGRGSSGFLAEGGAGAESIVEQLEEFRKDKSVRSLVLRVNSPGGSAAGSQEIYSEIMRVRKEGKKVTVSMGDVAASGGYYIASAADRIIADPATLTGSIGVIMQAVDIHELLDKYGVNFTTIKSGQHKDIGSFSRPMTAEERTILEGVIKDVFNQFVSDVSAGRNLPKSYVLKLADGRIYTGKQAANLKLVDRLGGLQDALKAAAADAGIKGEFSVVQYRKPRGILDLLFGGLDTNLLQSSGPAEALGKLAERFLQAEQNVSVR